MEILAFAGMTVLAVASFPLVVAGTVVGGAVGIAVGTVAAVTIAPVVAVISVAHLFV